VAVLVEVAVLVAVAVLVWVAVGVGVWAAAQGGSLSDFVGDSVFSTRTDLALEGTPARERA